MKPRLRDVLLFLHTATVVSTLFLTCAAAGEAPFPVGAVLSLRGGVYHFVTIGAPLALLVGLLLSSPGIRVGRPGVMRLSVLHVTWIAWFTWFGWSSRQSPFRVHEVVANPDDFERAVRLQYMGHAVLYIVLVGLYSGIPLGIRLTRGRAAEQGTATSLKGRVAWQVVSVLSAIVFTASVLAARLPIGSKGSTSASQWQLAAAVLALLTLSLPCSRGSRFALGTALALVCLVPLLDLVSWALHY